MPFPMCTLVLPNEQQKQFLQEKMQTTPLGETIALDEPPLAVNVRLVDVPPEDIKAWNDLSICDNEIIIPVMHTSPRWSNPTTIRGGQGFKASRVKTAPHFPLESGIAITVFKAQGHTIKKVILCVSKRPIKNLTHEAFFVANSRVKESDNIRFLSNSRGTQHSTSDPDELTHLTVLQPDPHTKIFFEGFARNGRWSAQKALRAFQTHKPQN